MINSKDKMSVGKTDTPQITKTSNTVNRFDLRNELIYADYHIYIICIQQKHRKKSAGSYATRMLA